MTTTDIAHVDQAKTDLTIGGDQTKFTDVQVASLKQIGVDDATPADLDVFFHQCVRTGLDPFIRQIYMIGRSQWDPKTKKSTTKQTIQTGIDGFWLIARRAADRAHETFSVSDTLWCGRDGIWHDVWLGEGQPAAAKVVVYRNGQPFPAVALFTEYAGTKSGGELTKMWQTKGALMLGKCVAALALRKAYPQDLSGVYSADEMSAADNEPVQQQRPHQQRHAVTQVPPVADEVIVGEVIDHEPMMTADQSAALFSGLADAGMGDKVSAVAFISDKLDREAVWESITRAEAALVLGKLQEMLEDPFVADAPPADAA